MGRSLAPELGSARVRQQPPIFYAQVRDDATRAPDDPAHRAVVEDAGAEAAPAAGSQSLSEDPVAFWDDYFAAHRPEPYAVRDAVRRLIDRRRFDHVSAVIQAAIRHGQGQHWMYEALALALRLDGADNAEIERALLSAADLAGTDAESQMHVAAFLMNMGSHGRALALFRQASRLDPLRPEPYLFGLGLAVELEDLESIQWAIVGVLNQAWPEQNDEYYARVLDQAALTVDALARAGRREEAEALSAAVAAAQQRDLVVRISWQGSADVDLVVEEPAGTVCSFRQRRTAAGGVLVRDGYGENGEEVYVCTRAMPGRYRIKVRRLWGQPVAGRVQLEVIRGMGTDHEEREEQSLSVGNEEVVVSVTLETGRREELIDLNLLSGAAESETSARVRRQARLAALREREQSSAAREFSYARTRTEAVAQAAERARGQGAGAGFQPVVIVLDEAISLQARAIVSADRRYVRLSVVPFFSVITDVDTFSFATGDFAGGGGGFPFPFPFGGFPGN